MTVLSLLAYQVLVRPLVQQALRKQGWLQLRLVPLRLVSFMIRSIA